MFYQREGFPEEGELVFCTVTKIQFHIVTASLDEFKGKQGLIHISEVSPGRIRNIRNYVTEGKKIICKVIRIDNSRGHIDLSLRRVNESQKRRKSDEIKQEQKAEKIVVSISERLKKPVEEVYDQLTEAIFEEYDYLYQAFEDVVEKNLSLESIGVEKGLAKLLEEIIKDKIKPKKVEIVMKVSVQISDENGLELVKKSFEKAKAVDEKIDLKYLGAGTFRMVIIAKDYKKAESTLKEIEKEMTNFVEKNKGELSFERQE